MSSWNEDEASMAQIRLKIAIGIGFLVFLLFGFLSCNVIKEGEIGIQTRFGKVKEVKYPGLAWKVPLMDSISILETRLLRERVRLVAATKEQLRVVLITSVNYRLNLSKEDELLEFFKVYKTVNQFTERVLKPTVQSQGKSVSTTYTLREMLQKREEFAATFVKKLSNKLAKYNVSILEVQIENITIPDSYREKVVAATQKKQEIEQQRLELERQDLEQQQKINIAKAEAVALRLQAQGKADALTIESKAEAKAIKLINQSLASSPNYIRLKQVEKWKGDVPKTVLGSQAVPLLNLK